jgi:hypothetical protein
VQKGGEDCRLLMPKPRCNHVSQLVELIEIELVIATDTITNSPWEWDPGSLLAARHSCGYYKEKMWGDGSDDETGTFYPDLLSLVSTCAHQMDIMGLDGMMGLIQSKET